MSIQLNPAESTDSNERETIKNPERGCGTLEEGKAYLKADMSPGGNLPAFVEFESPVPFKENRKRSYKKFPGIQFELSVTGEAGLTETNPEGEIHDHLNRLERDRPTGETAGEMVSFNSHDLLLSVGKSHYPDVDNFVNEAKVHGVSKAINVSSGVEPPEINPGRTRLFLIHPEAVEVEREVETTAGEIKTDDEVISIEVETSRVEDRMTDLDDDVDVTVRRTHKIPGVFGYSYLTRVVYTEDADGHIPDYIQDYEKTGDLDVVETGPGISYSEQEGFNDDGELTDDAEDVMESHYGGNLDVGAIQEGLDASKETISEWANGATLSDDTEPVNLEGLYPPAEHFRRKALEQPTTESMNRAELGPLAEGDVITGHAPPDGEDAVSGDEGGALAIVRQDDELRKVMPSNNVAFDDDMSLGTVATSVVGPYRVTVEDTDNDTRVVEVENTR